MNINSIIDTKKAHLDKNGIWVSAIKLNKNEETSKKAWERIYDFSLQKLKLDYKDFEVNKLTDHLEYIEKSFSFTRQSVYLEIGCGPAYIGEYLMKTYGSIFVGVDFNYPMLLTLKKFFESKKYSNFILIYADINNMPLKNNSIDYIYGGGVIEHLNDTTRILKELYRVLKKGGVSFNTVPAFNIGWLLRFYNNVPSLPVLRPFFEFIHVKLLKSSILEKYYGYELSYTLTQLNSLHKKIKFSGIRSGAFAFHPSKNRLHSAVLRKIYYAIMKNPLFCIVYYVYGKK